MDTLFVDGRWLKSKGATVFPAKIPNDPAITAKKLDDGWLFCFSDEPRGIAMNIACSSMLKTEFESLAKLFNDIRQRGVS